MRNKLWSFATSTQEIYARDVISFTLEIGIAYPYIVRMSVTPDGGMVAELSNGTLFPYGTVEGMQPWLLDLANAAGLTERERFEFVNEFNGHLQIDPEYLKRQSHALPPPSTTAEGAPMSRQQRGEVVPSIADVLGDQTLDDIWEYEGQSGELYLMIDLASEYPIDWTFEKVLYQPGQFDVHRFVDYLGDDRFSKMMILKHGPQVGNEPPAVAKLLCESMGDLSDMEVNHIVFSGTDELGNQLVWYYPTWMFPIDCEESFFDDEYIGALQRDVPDLSRWERIILEYDINYVDPNAYDEGGIGWMGIMVAALMLNNEIMLFRPEPSMVWDNPKRVGLRPEHILESVKRHNNLESDPMVTQFHPGMCFYDGMWKENPRRKRR
jgi:hypothetical protein